MKQEILINATPRETRVARLENGILEEVLIERAANKGIVGNIYLGKVVRVLPGMQAAFIDIGLERTAFLHARDLAADDPPDNPPNNSDRQTAPETPITSLLHQGQKVMLQAVKNPIGDKGARLSGQIGIPSRSLVYLPNSAHLGVSRRIEEPADRELLASVLTAAHAEVGAAGGFILRTAAKNATPEEIRADMEFLLRCWKQIQKRQSEQPAPSLLHRDLPLALRTLRDLAWQNIEKVRIDCAETYRQVVDFAAELIPDALDRLEHYPEKEPIFDLYAVEDEIAGALQKQVYLTSGGYLIFDQTEAMTTVDINTGSFVGAHNLEETIFQTNIEAVAALARQLRVRNIGGIIIIDFIDMGLKEHRTQVMRALEQALARDPVKTKVNQMSPLGLVEITRKRTSESLERLLTEPCPACQGRGTQKTAESTCDEIFRQLLRETRAGHRGKIRTEKYRVVASRAVIDQLKNESDSLADLRKFTGKTIELQVDPGYRQEQFNVVSG